MQRVTFHFPSDDLQTTVVRGVGYRARDANGWTGSKRRTYREALQDKRAHENEQAAHSEREAVTPAREREGC